MMQNPLRRSHPFVNNTGKMISNCSQGVIIVLFYKATCRWKLKQSRYQFFESHTNRGFKKFITYWCVISCNTATATEADYHIAKRKEHYWYRLFTRNKWLTTFVGNILDINFECLVLSCRVLIKWSSVSDMLIDITPFHNRFPQVRCRQHSEWKMGGGAFSQMKTHKSYQNRDGTLYVESCYTVKHIVPRTGSTFLYSFQIVEFIKVRWQLVLFHLLFLIILLVIKSIGANWKGRVVISSCSISMPTVKLWAIAVWNILYMSSLLWEVMKGVIQMCFMKN